MFLSKLPAEGGCRCDRVRIRISAPPLLTAACHCTGCQKMSSSAFSLSVVVPVDGFSVIAGEPVIGGARGAPKHHCCDYCKSWMFTRVEGMPFVNVRPTMLDDCGDFEPFMETWTEEMLPWARTGAKHSYPQFPAFDAYEGLVKEFAAGRQG